MKIKNLLKAVALSSITACTLISFQAGAATDAAGVPLEDQLKALELPSNQAPAMVSHEKLYSVQTRYLPLKFKSEVSLGVAQNLTGDSFLTTQQMTLGYRFHFSDRWSLGVAQSFVSNSFTSEGQHLINAEGIAPQIPYAKQRSEMTAAYNVFYGKIRLSAEQVFYFDQYVAVGPGLMSMNTGDVGAAVADIGFAFWVGKLGSTRIGVKDYVYNDGTGQSNNVHAHVDFAYIF